jgi:hypothetical protein
MKCFLLLAGVYALIFNQWYKDKGTALANAAPVKTYQAVIRENASPVKTTVYTPFLATVAVMNMTKESFR